MSLAVRSMSKMAVFSMDSPTDLTEYLYPIESPIPVTLENLCLKVVNKYSGL